MTDCIICGSQISAARLATTIPSKTCSPACARENRLRRDRAKSRRQYATIRKIRPLGD